MACRPLGAMRVLAIAVACSQLAACSFFGSGTQSLSISSEPAGAKVTVNGESFGTTPVIATVSRKRDASILVTKEGYGSQTRIADSKLGTLGILDIVGGVIWLVPFLGLLDPGAYELEPSNFTVVLEEE